MHKLLPTRRIVGIALVCGALQAVAADAPPLAEGTRTPGAGPKDWRWSVGAALVSFPRYPGSDAQRTLAVPSFEATFRDTFFIDPVKGIGWRQDVLEGLSLSASLALDLVSRSPDDSPRLAGFQEIRETFAARLGLEYATGRVFANLAVLSRVGREYRRGTTLDTDIGYNVIDAPSGVIGMGVNLRAMDDTFARNFFGVSVQQAATSGLGRFDAGPGLYSAGGFAQAFVPLGRDWSLFGRLQIAQLQGDAGDSPITERRLQPLLIVTVSRALR